jgi:hypothetical protein
MTPIQLQSMSDVRLAILDAQCIKELKKQIDKVAARDVRFARVLRESMMVDEEIERRAWRDGVT